MKGTKYLLLITSLVLFCGFSSALGQNFRPPSDEIPDRFVPNTTDREFIQEAARDLFFKIMAESLALSHSPSRAVRKFSNQLIRLQQRQYVQLNSLANQLGVPLVTAFEEGDSDALGELSGLFGRPFNRQYLLNLIQTILGEIQEYTNEARNGTNPTVRAFANRYLPELRQELQLAFAAVVQSGTRF